MGAPTRGRPLVYRRILTDTSPESLSCALAHIACGLHSASAAVNTKLALQLVRAFAAYFRERAWPSLLMRGALAALSPCSWDLMPRHLCGRSILSDGASPPAAPSLFGWHRICVCAILAVAGDCSGQQYTMGGGLVCRACGALVVASALPRRPRTPGGQGRWPHSPLLVLLLHHVSWRASPFSLDPPAISSAVMLLWDISIQGNTPVLAPPVQRRLLLFE